jgi:hypothetical protein
METPIGYDRIEHDSWLFECERCGCAVSDTYKHDIWCAGDLPFGLNADELRYNTWYGSNEVQVLHIPTGHVAVGSGSDYLRNKFNALSEIAKRLQG